MRIVTGIRVAVCSMMLACTGMLSVPLAAHAEGNAAAGEKNLRPLRPLPFDQAG